MNLVKRMLSERALMLHAQIREGLALHFPELHLFLDDRNRGVIRGTFPVIGPDGEALDRFSVSIELPAGYPRELPVTRETGGRIPWTASRHVGPDGVACVLLPDERWKVFPVDAPFLDYLRGPLYSFFLSQVAFETTGEWPFGEWAHGAGGILDFYARELGTKDSRVIGRFLDAISRREFRSFQRCPCGSGKRTRDCCLEKVTLLRSRISPTTASESLQHVWAELMLVSLLDRILSRVGAVALLRQRAGIASSVLTPG